MNQSAVDPIEDGPDPLVNYLSSKFTSPKSGSLWKTSFYLFKYLHVIMLAILFFSATNNLNRFRSLGFMLLFSFWSMSEVFYRKSVNIMIFFMSFFILGQYYFSLTYSNYLGQE